MKIVENRRTGSHPLHAPGDGFFSFQKFKQLTKREMYERAHPVLKERMGVLEVQQRQEKEFPELGIRDCREN